MTKQLISSGSTFEQQIGYSRAVVAGDWVFVSGTTGFDYSSMSIAEGLLEQTRTVPEEHRFGAAAGRLELGGRCARYLRAPEWSGVP